MLFNSFEFLIFFPTVVLTYFLIPFRFRWTVLLIASYIFYMSWRAKYAIILAASTIIDYCCGIMMSRYDEEDKNKRKLWLWLSLLSNLIILFTFKYYIFFSEAAADLATLLRMEYATPVFKLLLPMGISFYTFQTMSYSIDVYYGRVKAERHLGIFALFVTFFPQLVAGPIERASNLLSQLKTQHTFDRTNLKLGLLQMAWGYFKKLVIADRVGLLVNYVYDYPTYYEGVPLLITTILFSFQIYCDFSGYSDIAIGSARVMGFSLMENFRRPYFSRSISEFWGRWHISLSTWFRDYVYIPLGGNRVVQWRWYYNLIITFLISGLWHGANWTFILWGGLHGFYLVFALATADWRRSLTERIGLNYLPRVHHFLQVLSTYTLVCISWVLFRANSVNDAWYILSHTFTSFGSSIQTYLVFDYSRVLDTTFLGQPLPLVLFGILFIIILMLVEFAHENTGITHLLQTQHVAIKWMIAYALLLVIVIFGMHNKHEFIYFQF